MNIIAFWAFDVANWTSKRISGWRQPFKQPVEPPTRPLKCRLKKDWSTRSIHDQQCLLFSMLSKDIRLLIWTLVLGQESDDDVLHIDVGQGTLLSRRCLRYEQLDELHFKHVCWEIAWTEKDQKEWSRLARFAIVPDDRPLLPLLRSCKQIYNESFGILYAANTFDIRRAICFMRLPKALPPSAFNSIRSVQFSTAFHFPFNTHVPAKDRIYRTWTWMPPDDPANWPEACEVLASMQLRHLGITIALWTQQPKWDDVEDDVDGSIYRLLLPLLPIKASQFNVALTTEVPQAVHSRLGPLPFTISRNEAPNAGFEFHKHRSFPPLS